MIERVLAELRGRQPEYLDWVRALCRIPSISTRPERQADVAAAARWTAELAERVGLQAAVHETGGHPLVYAEHCAARGAPTLLVYGHFDVQPEGERGLWRADPFEPVVEGDWLVCRGAADDKGQFLLHFRAAAAWLAAAGRLPVNLKLLLEGEEEISSPNLAGYIERNRQRLACDAIVISDTGLYADGWPTITYGTRGLLYKEVRLSGPRHDLHSGSFGGTVANPANVLAAFIAGLHDDQGRVTIPGFYADVAELDEAERDAINCLPFEEDEYQEGLGAPALTGEAGYTTNERRWTRPTLDVNGLYGGFMQEGANTIIPARAGAKISMRLVPNQNAVELGHRFDQAVRERVPPTVRAEILTHGACDPYVAPLDSPFMRAARRALAEGFANAGGGGNGSGGEGGGREVALVREGGSLPILPMFKRLLGADSLLLGFASPQCNAHGPNEKVYLPDLERGAEALARLWDYLGRK